MTVPARTAPHGSRESARPALLAKVVGSVQADQADYDRLRQLLEAQFQAALRHQSDALVDIAAQITDLVAVLEERRGQRVEAAAKLLGLQQPSSMVALFDLLAPAPRAALAASWDALEGLVNECKTMNLRNGRLLMGQHEIMQRVLNGESDTYAPR